MSEEPLSIGGGFLAGGFIIHILAPTLSAIADVHIRGWAWLFLLVGLTTIALRLLTMVRAGG